MAASLTVYLLDELTDYAAFESLCNDLMVLDGYPKLEPLGGFKDKGRDAIHVTATGITTIFAYSVREDWRAKLSEDATKVKKHNHSCDEFVFLTTADFTAGERDEAVKFIANTFGWTLHLYGSERLRTLLDVKHPQVKHIHPQIFPPDFLEIQSRNLDRTDRKHLLINSAPADFPLADWLSRKLTAEGYLVWHSQVRFSSDDTFPSDIDEALKNETFRFIALYSKKSLKDPDLMRQRSLALSIAKDRKIDFVIPIRVNEIDKEKLDRATAVMEFIPFDTNWADGLNRLLKKLDSIGCPKPLAQGKTIAARAFIYDGVLTDQQELLVSNYLLVEHIPEYILVFECEKEISEEQLSSLSLNWAFRKIASKKFLAIHHPVSEITKESGCFWVDQKPWRDLPEIEGISSLNLISELMRKSLMVKAHEKGLLFCEKNNFLYFPEGMRKGNRVTFKRPDGIKSFVQVAGQRKYWRPNNPEIYKYFLAPVFRITRDFPDKFALQIRLRIRLTDIKGTPLEGRTIVSRRKHLCGMWFNDEWLNRLCAVCEFLSDGKKIVIGGEQDESLIIDGVPICVIAPQGIDEAALGQLVKSRSQLEGLDEPDDEIEGESDKGE
jgi:TIR domain